MDPAFLSLFRNAILWGITVTQSKELKQNTDHKRVGVELLRFSWLKPPTAHKLSPTISLLRIEFFLSVCHFRVWWFRLAANLKYASDKKAQSEAALWVMNSRRTALNASSLAMCLTGTCWQCFNDTRSIRFCLVIAFIVIVKSIQVYHLPPG